VLIRREFVSDVLDAFFEPKHIRIRVGTGFLGVARLGSREHSPGRLYRLLLCRGFGNRLVQFVFVWRVTKAKNKIGCLITVGSEV